MHRFFKGIALGILGVSFGALDVVVWFGMHLPFGLETMNLELNQTFVPWSVLIRSGITGAFCWTFLYFNTHCVVANREESTRVITKG
ncbi:MAG: hypothetical protein ACRDHZ_01970 [Ktedonobacteraceae bacterium]